MIVDEIKKDNIQALKNKDTVARAIYGVVLNKIMLFSIDCREAGKEMQDSDTVQILQKTIKELLDEQANYKKVAHETEAENCGKQIELLKKYLPQMLSEEEIRAIVAGLDDKSLPAVMKYFKANYAGKVDMGLVNKVARG